MKKIFILLCVSALAGGCGAVKQSAQPPAARPTANAADTADMGEAADTTATAAIDSAAGQRPLAAMSVSAANGTRSSLLQAYQDWKGTPYRFGGSSQNGVDCSMFINIVFEDYFGIDLPTNTRTQLNAGEGIRRAAIRTGDLIFFRTGRRTLHVGIVLNDKEFLHASTSKGVTISRMSRKYWANRYLAARRVL